MVRYALFVSFLFVVFSARVIGQYGHCTGHLNTINDGQCDMDNNNEECGYDGGDCCKCSCTNDRMYPCGIVGYNCFNPDVLDVLDNTAECQNESKLARNCSSDAPVTWLVNDTASAKALAGAVNCSGGAFNVTWLGNVLIDRTLYIPDGTSLYVTGNDSGAEVNGGGKTRLFMAVGADLHIEGLILSNGNATYGGAIAALRSNLSLNQTLFIDNIASTYGGAIYAGMNSTVVWGGRSALKDNTAGKSGGAVAVSMSSNASWDGNTEFSFNTATSDESFGGALFVNDHSKVEGNGEMTFANNAAGNSGGALSVLWYSSASWNGATSFENNTASNDGGALYVYLYSILLWDGDALFANNAAGNSGGALSVSGYSSVSWNGVTFFENNSASNDGGALYVYLYSTVLWDGDTLFSNNIVTGSESAFFTGRGGALSVSYSCFVTWDGNALFLNNTAMWSGGALYIYSYSTASWGGETSFINNAASQSYGGAVDAHTYCTVLWDGRTSFVNSTAYYAGALSAINGCTVSWSGQTSFMNNKVRGGGGAVVAGSRGYITWDGETSFLNNTASEYGGALYVEFDTTVSWKGETSFVGNNASSGGGALFVFLGSTVMWDGNTSFVYNIASDDGGALNVWSESSVTWTGNTSFRTNTALSSGGAIYVFSDSNITMEGDSYFTDNKATTDGGAVYVYVSYADKIPSYFSVDNNSVVFFQGNTCGGNGGAIAFIGGVVSRFSSNVTFRGNTAEVAGGAIYMSGMTFGMPFEGTRFLSNSAVVGGGLYSTGSGTAVTDVFSGNPVNHPTTFIECEFIGNKAIKTGGAIDSGAGRDLLVNTSFVGNTAMLGGALRLVGTTSLIGCDFVNNLSGEDEGPGVSNDGVIESVSYCSFANNSFNCQTGFFLVYNKTGALFGTVCKGCDKQCTECEFEGKEPICLEKLEHSMSTGGTTTLESLSIDRGYWRATNTSTDILACYNTDACLGGLTGEQGYCRKGYEGPYCSVCSKGYTTSLGFNCNKCSGNAAGGVAFAVVMAIVLLIAILAFLSYMLSGVMMGTNQGIVARLTRFIPLQSVKIVIVVWQILTQFSTVANVVFPSVYQSFLDGVDVLNFNLSWLVPMECIIDTDFHDQLLLATLGPLVCIAILGGTYILAMRQSNNSEEARKIARRKHVSMVLLLTFLVYSSVSSTLFKTFACDKLDDGKNYLRADYRIECDSLKHDALEVYACFMVVLYVVGIPAFYGILLYNNREALMKNLGREEDDSVKFITDLWKSCRPNRFYYEVIECVRRVLLTGALVFIYPNTAAQIAVALMMATLFIFVSEAMAPYASRWDTWCSRTGHAIVYTSMFLALLLKVDVSGERPESQRVFESVLIAAHSCLVLFVVAEAFTTVIVWRREEVKEVAEPRIRP